MKWITSLAIAVVVIGGTANAQEPLEAAYKHGESWPGRNFNGLDFLEPFLPLTAASRGDVGRIVLDTGLPYSLLIASMFPTASDGPPTREIRRWQWITLDAKFDHYPSLFFLAGLGVASAFLPAPEDEQGFSWDLRLDRLTVYGLGMILTTAQRELYWRAFQRQRPDKNGFDARPSGHAASAFAAATFISNNMRDWLRPADEPSIPIRIVKEVASAVPYLGALGMALARVKFRRHYLTDTFLGAALGTFTMNLFYAWSFTEREQGKHWVDVTWFVGAGPRAFEVALLGEF